jgi:NADP-dependent 3-hydroxy acid dehydrogenase YdfG
MMAKAVENRCAFITGASAGLGFEIAKKYLEAGASVMICARSEMLESLPNHLDDLKDTDIYTLQRIVPEDRGMAWGDRD